MRNRRTATYLRIFDALPDLLKMARQESSLPAELYRLQKSLREAYHRHRLPFKWSTPLRHSYHCSKCGLNQPEVLYELENPTPLDSKYPLRLLKILESEIHQVRVHDEEFKEEYVAFFENIMLPLD